MSERFESSLDENVIVNVTTSDTNNGTRDGTLPYPIWQTTLIILLLSIMIIGTIIGNVLVCLAVCLVRKLRHPSNYLIVSLAVSDMCVAFLVMPFALLYEILGKWVLGTDLCDLWVAFDVMMCTASILNLCMISVDRYFAITKPLQYAMKRTPKRMLISIAIVWLVAALVSIPPLLLTDGNIHTNDMCLVNQTFLYQIYATLFAFYLPLTVMVIVYYKIYVAAKRITDAEVKAQRTNSIFRAESIKPKQEDNNPRSNGILPKERIKKVNFTDNSKLSEWIIKRLPHRRQQCPVKKVESSITRERKASKTLGVIMGAFILCWLPFFITALLRSFLPSCDIPNWLTSVFLWLGYTNSLLNPIIYARFNKDFRKPFKEIICLRCKDLQRILRSETYSSQYGSPAITRQLIKTETVLRYDSVSSTANIDLPNQNTVKTGESHV